MSTIATPSINFCGCGYSCHVDFLYTLFYQVFHCIATVCVCVLNMYITIIVCFVVSYGQLGIDSKTVDYIVAATPFCLDGIKIKYIGCGEEHTVALVEVMIKCIYRIAGLFSSQLFARKMASCYF